MISSGNTIERGQRIAADVCIIGAGPAGITLALKLRSSALKVIVLSGGGWSESAFAQDLNRGVIWPPNSHEPLEENRRRQLGGTSSAWGGRCVPFEAIDFETRAWVPDSGWPLGFNDIAPYYKQASELCLSGSNDFNSTSVFPNSQKEILPGFDSAEIISYALERWSPPINFAKHYRGELARSNNVDVLLNAHALRFHANADGRIQMVESSLNGKPFSVESDCFVLAAGGIENARLLLASQSENFPCGLGNQNDNVGRYYMSHLSGVCAEVALENKKNIVTNFERDLEGVYCRRRWWITEAAQREHRLLNTIFFLTRPDDVSGHRDVLFSTRFVAKALLSIASCRSVGDALNKTKSMSGSIKQHSFNIAANGFWELPSMIKIAMQRMSYRRLPYMLPSNRTDTWGLHYQAEHAPNRQSRVLLSEDQRDVFGIPRAEVRVAFSRQDRDSVLRAHQLFARRFSATRGGGLLNHSTKRLEEYIDAKLKNFNSAAHHLGTTRMSDDARNGVVDRNSKVFGLSNLYVAGSSVFPTGGHANPTLTIVAQALMLADYLTKQNARSASCQYAPGASEGTRVGGLPSRRAAIRHGVL
jgi:choline dehydrogenase-like flavoprotein